MVFQMRTSDLMTSEVKIKRRIKFQSLPMLIVSGTFFCFLVFSCGKPEPQPDGYAEIVGKAQGTTYSITYFDTLGRNLKPEVDSLLSDFDWQLSTYLDSSLISDFNNADVQYYCQIVSEIMAECVHLSRAVYIRSSKAFNPAVYPLVELWGFYDIDNPASTPSQQEIDSIMEFISFDPSVIQLTEPDPDEGIWKKIKYTELCKADHRSRLDFNAIAQGYSVDLIGRYFESRDIHNYMIELGGEVKCKGINDQGKIWNIGIDRPEESDHLFNREANLKAAIRLNDKGMATSGNYRKFYEVDGVKYSHTIDPRTGKPVTHSLLSATVVSHSTAIADAYATAFMVMGLEETKSFLTRNGDLDLQVYLIYSESDGSYGSWMSENIKGHMTEFD